MLEIPPEWNVAPDLIMEDEEELMITKTDNKRKIDEVAQGRRKWRKENDICLEKLEHFPTVFTERETQKDSIPKTGMSPNKKKMNGRCQTNGRGFLRWGLMADVWS